MFVDVDVSKKQVAKELSPHAPFQMVFGLRAGNRAHVANIRERP
jgi:hypothetical protein